MCVIRENELHLIPSSQEVWKSNFRQYGDMEKQRWEESERRRKEERRSEKRKNEKKEDAGARRGRKVAIHCVSRLFCDSAGSKSRLAKAASAEPSGQMRNEELHAIAARSTLMYTPPRLQSTFRS